MHQSKTALETAWEVECTQVQHSFFFFSFFLDKVLLFGRISKYGKENFYFMPILKQTSSFVFRRRNKVWNDIRVGKLSFILNERFL